jgi:hypothetical protein
MGKKNFEQQSRDNWVPAGIGDDASCNTEQLKVGCLQRIAKATEVMAESNQKLKQDYEYMRQQRDKYREWYESMVRRHNAQKGVITKLRKKLKNG